MTKSTTPQTERKYPSDRYTPFENNQSAIGQTTNIVKIESRKTIPIPIGNILKGNGSFANITVNSQKAKKIITTKA